MPRISVIFKPQKSWIACELQTNWFYEVRYNALISWEKYVKNKLKVMVAWVPYGEIANLYENVDKYFNQDAVVLFMCRISDLFE